MIKIAHPDKNKEHHLLSEEGIGEGERRVLQQHSELIPKQRLVVFNIFGYQLTSSCDEPMSNPNPEKDDELTLEFRENMKAGDLVSEVPLCGELVGLKLKSTQEEQSDAIIGFNKARNRTKKRT